MLRKQKKEDLNCVSTGCLHTDDRLRAQAQEGAEDGGKGGGRGADGHEIMTDILGLASCDALVGTMTSQVRVCVYVCVCVCVCVYMCV